MIRSYTKIIYVKAFSYDKIRNSEDLNLKLNEALEAIQKRGGIIISSSCVNEGCANAVLSHIVYEDNENFEEINSYLRDVVFNFTEIKLK